MLTDPALAEPMLSTLCAKFSPDGYFPCVCARIAVTELNEWYVGV